MVRCNQHSGQLATQAQQEIDIMLALRNEPKTPSEICAEFGLPKNRVSYLLRGLYEAKCIRKVKGTHIIYLDNANPI